MAPWMSNIGEPTGFLTHFDTFYFFSYPYTPLDTGQQRQEAVFSAHNRN